MNKENLVEYIKHSNIYNKWHWLNANFRYYLENIKPYPYFGKPSQFFSVLIDELLYIDNYIPNYSTKIIDMISSYSDKQNELYHYDQILQVIGEVYVISQVVKYFKDEATYDLEPKSLKSKKNPEINIKSNGKTYGIEVKTISLMKVKKLRENINVQIPARNEMLKASAEKELESKIMYPRDNTIKDYIESANSKFSEFKKCNASYYSLLFILWDDYIYEVISPLLTKPSGLLLPTSYSQDTDGKINKYENLDIIMIDRFALYYYQEAANQIISDRRENFFDTSNSLPVPYVFNLHKKDLLNSNEFSDIIKCFNALPIEECYGSEYCPSDLIWWIKMQ